LGGNRYGKFKNIFNLYLTMILIGLWHGAGTFFIIYGMYLATIILLYKAIPFDKIFIKVFGQEFGKILAMSFLLPFLIFAAMIFWTKTTEDFFTTSQSFFQIFPMVFIPSQFSKIFLDLLVGSLIFIVPIISTDILGYRKRREFIDLYPGFKNISKILIYLTMFYTTILFASRGNYEFIYFQF
jgi:alginate O-acetyltransferase complex protein AlgI